MFMSYRIPLPYVFLFATLLCLQPAAAQYADTLFLRYADEVDIHDNPIYTTDTLTFNSPLARNILIGTTVLPGAAGVWTLYDYGYSLQRIESTPCYGDYESPDFGNDKVNTIRQTDSTLEVDVTIYDNCCYSFLCTATIDSSNTMHLNYIGYGSLCACSCCFGLTYIFSRDGYSKNTPLVTHIMIGDLEPSRRVFSSD